MRYSMARPAARHSGCPPTPPSPGSWDCARTGRTRRRDHGGPGRGAAGAALNPTKIGRCRPARASCGDGVGQFGDSAAGQRGATVRVSRIEERRHRRGRPPPGRHHRDGPTAGAEQSSPAYKVAGAAWPPGVRGRLHGTAAQRIADVSAKGTTWKPQRSNVATVRQQRAGAADSKQRPTSPGASSQDHPDRNGGDLHVQQLGGASTPAGCPARGQVARAWRSSPRPAARGTALRRGGPQERRRSATAAPHTSAARWQQHRGGVDAGQRGGCGQQARGQDERAAGRESRLPRRGAAAPPPRRYGCSLRPRRAHRRLPSLPDRSSLRRRSHDQHRRRAEPRVAAAPRRLAGHCRCVACCTDAAPSVRVRPSIRVATRRSHRRARPAAAERVGARRVQSALNHRAGGGSEKP